MMCLKGKPVSYKLWQKALDIHTADAMVILKVHIEVYACCVRKERN